MNCYNNSRYEIINELQKFAYEQQEIEEEKYQKKFWKNSKLSKKNEEISYHIPQRVLRNTTIISHLFLLDSKDKIIKMLLSSNCQSS